MTRAQGATLSAFVLLMLAYAASPLVTLWRLDGDVGRGDVASLSRAVDWPKVRAGLRADLAAALTGLPAVQTVAAEDDLPSFGSGMMTRIADDAVATDVTPDGLMRMLDRPSRNGPRMALDWALPTGLTSFEAAFGPEGKPPIRIRLDLARGLWRITRVWLPASMTGASART